jgi:hypothetical protein
LPWCTINQRKEPPIALHTIRVWACAIRSQHKSFAMRWFAQLQRAGLPLPQRSSHACLPSWIPALADTAKPMRQSVELPPRQLLAPVGTTRGNAGCVQNLAICPSRKAARSLGHVIVSKWPIGATCVHIAGSHQLSTRPTRKGRRTMQCQCRYVQ